MRTAISFTYPRCWACNLDQQFGTRVRILSQEQLGRVTQEEVELWADSRGKMDEMLAYLASYPYVESHEVLSRSKDGCIVKARIWVNHDGCPISLTVQSFQQAGEPTFERIDYTGRINWSMNVKGAKKLAKLTTLLERKHGVQDVTIRSGFAEKPMSKSMFQLKEAVERGYFDVPKRISIEELSAVLGVPLSTLNVNIRRSLNKVLREGIR